MSLFTITFDSSEEESEPLPEQKKDLDDNVPNKHEVEPRPRIRNQPRTQVKVYEGSLPSDESSEDDFSDDYKKKIEESGITQQPSPSAPKLAPRYKRPSRNSHRVPNKRTNAGQIKSFAEQNISKTLQEESNIEQQNLNKNHEPEQISSKTPHYSAIPQFDQENIFQSFLQKSNTSFVEQIESQKYTTERVTYQFVKFKHVMLRGTRIHYQLFLNDQPLLHSKTKGNNFTQIDIAEGSEMHFSSKEFAAVIYIDQKIFFDLRDKDQYGPELMTIKFSQIPQCSRVTRCFFMNEHKTFPSKLQSLNPIDPSFSSKFPSTAIPSPINTVLVDDQFREVVKVFKIEENRYEIIAPPEMPYSYIMMFGITMELCPYQ